MVSWESLNARPVPEWFDDAKLGVLVAWGPYAVPAWAPLSADLASLVAEKGWEHSLARDPRPEWYANGMRIPGSPTWEHHRSAWGRLTRYESFGRLFRQGLKGWDPTPLVDSVAGSGARYLVFTAKHHDGFLLWPSRRRNPRRSEWQSPVDVVGDLGRAARDRGLRFGLYYSGGLDWTFRGLPIKDLDDLLEAVPSTATYAAYADAQMRELITRYQPAVLWNDVCSAPGQDLLSLFDFYYRSVADGLVNDRFGQFEPKQGRSPGRRFAEIVGRVLALRNAPPSLHAHAVPAPRHRDFRTLEAAEEPSEEGKWERVRPLGLSAGFNSAEAEESLMSAGALVRLLADTVAHGGNLLLCAGLTAAGVLPGTVAERLRGLGEWLRRNGEAIYATRPWEVAEAATQEGMGIRYTRKGMTLYAILLGTPAERSFLLPSLRLAPYASLRVLGSVGHAAWFQEGKDVQVRLSEPLREAPAQVVSITPIPRGS